MTIQKKMKVYVSGGDREEEEEDTRNSCSEKETKKSKTGSNSNSSSSSSSTKWRGNIDLDHPRIIHIQTYSIFVATWNVGGRSPPCSLPLEDWLHASAPADLYVLGFQEIVPLNAGNVLGAEDNGPAKKWHALIRRALNNIPGGGGGGVSYTPSPSPAPVAEQNVDFEGMRRERNGPFFHRRSFQTAGVSTTQSWRGEGLERRFSVCDRVFFGHRRSDGEGSWRRPSDCSRWGSSEEDYGGGGGGGEGESPSTVLFRGEGEMGRYCLVASKQMVGILLTVWVRSELRECVGGMKVSCVGRGLMGYLGNKGSISVSMMLHETNFCFVCTHLTSGEREGDELRRNSDVVEILRKTRFPRVRGGDDTSPQTILEHDRVIWLGDLNYRIAMPYRSARALVEMQNWRVLLEKDQLRLERRRGRVFEGWKEGNIYFPPTYKYSPDSDRYAGQGDTYTKEKKRTPAWCDRILWRGEGLYQLTYVRAESRFSDHRPVYGIFCAEVQSVHPRSGPGVRPSTSRLADDCLPYAHGFTELSFF